MRHAYELSKELVVEVLCTTIAFVAIFAIAVAAEWAINEIGQFFQAGQATAWGARVFKYALSIFDLYIFVLMLYRIHQRHRGEMS